MIQEGDHVKLRSDLTPDDLMTYAINPFYIGKELVVKLDDDNNNNPLPLLVTCPSLGGSGVFVPREWVEKV